MSCLFLFINFCFHIVCFNSLTSAEQCKNKTLCGAHGMCLNGNCLCDVYYYGDNCQNGKYFFVHNQRSYHFFFFCREMNATNKVSFVSSGIQQDVIPIFITTFIFGIPILFALGVSFFFFFSFSILEKKVCGIGKTSKT